jgi:hypothetical protein
MVEGGDCEDEEEDVAGGSDIGGEGVEEKFVVFIAAVPGLRYDGGGGGLVLIFV